MGLGGATTLKRITLLAPGVFPPLSEGRKRFVLDLDKQFGAMGYLSELVTGPDSKQGGRLLLQAFFQLIATLLRSKPDLLLAFPYGRFVGARGIANVLFTVAARFAASIAGVRFATVLYSADGAPLPRLRALFGRLAAVGCHSPGVGFVHLGLGEEVPIKSIRAPGSPPRLLFLCGYQKPEASAVKGVLQERGLELLLRSLGLIDRPLSLTIAIPFLRDRDVREELQRLAQEHCPATTISWVAEGDPRELLASHDAFVFPYVVDHEVFVPTSMLEAMAIGVPVVATDLRMYRALSRDESEPTHYLAESVTPAALKTAMDRYLDDPAAALQRAQEKRVRVIAAWNIGQAAKDVLSAASK